LLSVPLFSPIFLYAPQLLSSILLIPLNQRHATLYFCFYFYLFLFFFFLFLT
jgi:hypothetical protein